MTRSQRLTCIRLLREEVIPLIDREEQRAITEQPVHTQGFQQDYGMSRESTKNTVYLLETFSDELEKPRRG